MAYIIGLISPNEIKELEKRGWELEDAPKELIAKIPPESNKTYKMVWVDCSMFDAMTGPDWEDTHI